MSKSVEQTIRELAYKKWERAGRPPGDGKNFWREAEAEINGDSGKSAAKVAPKTPAGKSNSRR